MSKRTPETAIAKAAIAWLEGEGWDVYQEVRGPAGNIADVVGLKDGRCAVVECKAALGATVCIQAFRWRHDADLLWICVGQEPRDLDVRHFYKDWMRWKGIGLLVADEARVRRTRIAEMPEVRQRRSDALVEQIRPEHKTYAAAGSPNGKVWSPYKDTCGKVRAYLVEHPGAGIAEVVKALGKLHYSSAATARATILKRSRKGIFEGVRVEEDGRLYAEDA